MANAPHNLDENAELLLYAAGELPAPLAADLERRLASSPALRHQLADLQSAMANAEGLFADADASQPVDPRTKHRAEGQALAAIASWQADRKPLANAKKPARRTLPPALVRIGAVAAIVVLTLVGSRVLREMGRPQNRMITQNVETPGLLDMSDPFHTEQVAKLAGDLDLVTTHGVTPSTQNTELAQREERSAAIIEAVAVAAPLTEDPVLSLDVPLDAE